MKFLIKTVMAGAAAYALAAPAFAYTINGTIPANTKPVVIALHKPIAPGILKLTFSAPPVNAGVPYVITFCIGPAAHPCVLPMSVLAGQQAVVPVDSGTISADVITVAQGTKVPVPYTLDVDALP